MLDAVPLQHQRCRGEAAVTLMQRSGVTTLKTLRQAGSAKAMLPRAHGAQPEIVFLNTAGGLTGGDRMTFALTLEDGASAVAATQTAERVYASSGGRARVDVTLTAGAGAQLCWLPQETILFDRSGLDRTTTLQLAPGASAMMVETLVLGRHAMGERLADVDLIDRRRIEAADGRPLFQESLSLGTTDLAAPDAPAGLAGFLAMTTLVLAGPTAGDQLGRARGAVSDMPNAAASLAGEVLVLRLAADDAFVLRHRTAHVIAHLTGRALPRVWQI